MAHISSPRLTAETRQIVAATKPALEEHGVAITTRMYERLFSEHPRVESMFAEVAPAQAERLAGAVLAYAENIESVEELVPVVHEIAAKHVAAGVQPGHYEIVGDALLGAMVDVLGELDPTVIDAWGAAYGYLASIFIDVEASLSTAS